MFRINDIVSVDTSHRRYNNRLYNPDPKKFIGKIIAWNGKNGIWVFVNHETTLIPVITGDFTMASNEEAMLWKLENE